MKKFRLLSLLTALMLTASSAFAPVRANPDEEPAPPATTQASVPPETTEPVETEPTMPAGFQGDASVAYGSRTLDAQKPLSDTDDYKAKAKAALLYDLNSDSLVFAQDIDVQLFPASLTKVMTCLLTLEMEQDLDKLVTVTAEGLKGQEPGGSNIALKVGEEISVKDLLYGLMVKSGNDAASVLAVNNSGSIEAFVEVMNRRAAELGCTGTHFMNPHGLHHDEHYTTARDMARILREAMKYPLFEEIFTTKEYTVPATNLSEAREMKTTNFLIRSNGYPYVLDSRVLGGKTGNTSKAGRCLVTLSEKDGMRLISVILGAKAVYGADGYSFARYGNFEETSAMLDFAYGRFTTMQVLHPTQVAGQFAVSGGAHNAFGAISESMAAAVPLGSDINSIRYEYSLTGNLSAPVAKDQEIGVVRVWYENTCLAQQTLRSASAVAVEEKRQDQSQEQEDDSEGIWNSILTGILIAVAVIFVLVMALRIRAAAIRRRRRRRKNAAKAKQKRRS
ncbi:MAG: D-alanyl-D-alanine carboxypeptidase [Oscillospiraceae bacterium]|nr:D-alanyl-D-alanine carboxypeptidase [Oscillospiraceae bacterium]